jgi:hypothetical protein
MLWKYSLLECGLSRLKRRGSTPEVDPEFRAGGSGF